MEIKQINLKDIPSEIIVEGRRNRLIFRDSDNATYFGGFIKDELVCLTCLVIYSGGTAAIKSNFTVKEHRGKGYFTELNKYTLKYVWGHGVKSITLNCLKDSVGIHLKQGARIWKTTKTIFWLVYDGKH